MTSHRWRLFFKESTRVVECDLTMFPLFWKDVFNFKTFSEIMTAESDANSCLFDVISEVVQVGRARDYRGSDRSTQSIDFIFRDCENLKLYCTVWDEYVSVLTSYMENPVATLVLILQLCQARFYRGEAGLSNTFYATKLIYLIHSKKRLLILGTGLLLKVRLLPISRVRCLLLVYCLTLVTQKLELGN